MHAPPRRAGLLQLDVDGAGRSLVIPCLNIQPSVDGCLERSGFLTVTPAGAPDGV